MKKPKVAVLSFPGMNCEVESLCALRRNGMDARFFRWNDDRSVLEDVDGYFLPGGFSYEDRGRSGMVAARDPLMEFIGREAERGKAVIGNCNGAQILVESGLIPLPKGLTMSLARNAIEEHGEPKAVGFLSEWVWISPSCERDRCATSDWKGVMHLPIAHGEGRFTTRDPELLKELKTREQIAFSYCDEAGHISDDVATTPNGSSLAIAGLCNPDGNVVALMPHPERTPLGDPYFQSLCRWLQQGRVTTKAGNATSKSAGFDLHPRTVQGTEIFIDLIIVNNEERTVEQAARRITPSLGLKQLRYVAVPEEKVLPLLRSLSFFNPHKELAYIRRNGQLSTWESRKGKEVPLKKQPHFFAATKLLRRDEPDTSSASLGEGAVQGIVYAIADVEERALANDELLAVFANPHASTLERLP
ncbi:MAG: phosphoribosylformylglycinamidine synthase subunit PurQ [Candidatus Peregrinibacteria bacterium]|nr:phosphoribosylformylglycinamidine synthase subunit PurQ [Candidatus Peregrinibacteria bacterium]